MYREKIENEIVYKVSYKQIDLFLELFDKKGNNKRFKDYFNKNCYTNSPPDMVEYLYFYIIYDAWSYNYEDQFEGHHYIDFKEYLREYKLKRILEE